MKKTGKSNTRSVTSGKKRSPSKKKPTRNKPSNHFAIKPIKMPKFRF